MHCLAGLDRPTSGTVIVDGVDLGTLDDAELTELRRDKVGFIFQFFNLLPVLDAREHMLLPLKLAGRDPEPGRLEQLAESVGITDRLDHRPSELSGGQQQRVAIARALLSAPAVVFADEPTGNLDSQSSEEVLGMLRKAVDDLGQTVVMVTHDPVAASTADRVVVLVDGKIVRNEAADTPEQVHDLMKQVAK
jgi:putative ABC transport system ATP-binding protein